MEISGTVVNFFLQINSAHREDSDHIFCKFHCNICLRSKNYNYLKFFLQSEQVIKQRFWLKNNLQLSLTLSLNTERAADIHYWSIWSVDEKVV